MKTFNILAFAFFFGSFTQAQTLADAIKKTENERYDVAGKEFRALIAKEPTRADYYFYYGENFCEHEDLDSANMMWKKGVEIDPLNALNHIGLGKYLWFIGDTTAANVHLLKASTMTKNKNAEVMRQTAIVWIRTPKMKKINAAIALLDKAIKLDDKNPENYILLGDAYLAHTPENVNAAISNYNLALGLNPKSPKTIVRTGKLYQRSANYELANSKYIEAQTIDPSYAPAYRENAELNMKFNQSAKAIENWKKYLALNNSIDARYRYATSLFSGKKYCEAIVELLAVQASGFNNYYIERMLTYCYLECTEGNTAESFKKGLTASEKFFSMIPNDKILASDYKYKGLLLSKTGSDSLAIIELEKAYTIDPEKNRELMGDVAKMQMKAKKYDAAIVSYNLKMNSNSTNLSANELFDLGRAYYFGPKNYVLADSCYKSINLRSPSFALAYFWRARSCHKIDEKKDKWLAQPHYEKYLELLTPEETSNPNNKAFIIEAAKYLGDYYVNSVEGKDYAKAKIYWEKVKALDPADKQVAAFFASPAGK